MSNSYFEFKYFTVRHDRCAMKVGTDGVLLGAWTPVGDYRRVLDVGAGSGLISLQIAQRMPLASIVALEIDADAASQARENVAASPWADRIEVVCENFNDFESEGLFDLIVSNPPFYMDDLTCPDRQRNLARHVGNGLNYDSLFRRSARLLSADGVVCVVIPAERADYAIDVAWSHGLHPFKFTRVYTKQGKPCRRVLMALGTKRCMCEEDTLCLMNDDGSYSAAYAAIVKDFYLNM